MGIRYPGIQEFTNLALPENSPTLLTCWAGEKLYGQNPFDGDSGSGNISRMKHGCVVHTPGEEVSIDFIK